MRSSPCASRFAFDAASPVYAPTVDVRPAGRAVVVLTSPLGRWAATYRGAFERGLQGYGVRGVRVEMAACGSPAAVARAFGRPAVSSSLGVVVALGRSATGLTPATSTAAVLGAALRGVQAAALPAVVSEVPGSAVAVNHTIDAQAAAAGLPLSAVAAVMAAPAAGVSPPPGAAASAGSPGAAVGDSLTTALVVAWARLDAATFVRAVQPAFFAPRLAATRLGVTYYERTLTRVAVVGAAAAAGRLIARLDVFGYVAAPAPAGSLAPAALPTVYYHAADRRLALALAGDLGLRTSQVVQSAGGSRGLTVVIPA